MNEQMISQLGFIQFAVKPGDIEANYKQVEAALGSLLPPAGTLLALPEMWATGFVYEDLATLAGVIPALLEKLENLAHSYNIVMAGSLPWKKQIDGNVHLTNRLFFSGICQEETPGIDKQHLFSFWKEDQWLKPGEIPTPIDVGQDSTIGGLVCYDLRFPESAQRQCRQGAEILLMSAQWPLARIEQWRILLQARAIENQCFIVAANACGHWDQLQLGGHSMVIAPDGEVLVEAGEEQESQSISFNREVQKELRERFNTVAGVPWAKDDSEKLLSLAQLAVLVEKRKKIGQQIVFTNGCFDILHAGHVDYLQKARKQGDFLVLGLNDDQSIRSIKGVERPINNEQHRARVLAALGCVDAIVLFGDDTPITLITTLHPDILVKGADWAEDEIVGAAEVKADGGRVERIVFTSQTSTTQLIQQIKKQ